MRRRSIEIDAAAGPGVVAGIELGPEDQPVDVLFLHANGLNALTYRHVMAELDPSLRLLAVDLRGHGHTRLPVPAAHPGWQVFADDLLALIAALGPTPRMIAGHSMGASAALLAAPAVSDPGRGVTRLLLLEPVVIDAATRAQAAGRPLWDHPLAQGALRRRATFATREEALELYETRDAFRNWQEAMLPDYVADGLLPLDGGGFTLACTPAWEAANFANAATADPVAGLLACGMPVTIFTAAHGSTCSLAAADLPDAARARVTIERLPGTSHFLPMERPGIVCRAINDALCRR